MILSQSFLLQKGMSPSLMGQIWSKWCMPNVRHGRRRGHCNRLEYIDLKCGCWCDTSVTTHIRESRPDRTRMVYPCLSSPFERLITILVQLKIILFFSYTPRAVWRRARVNNDPIRPAVHVCRCRHRSRSRVAMAWPWPGPETMTGCSPNQLVGPMWVPTLTGIGLNSGPASVWCQCVLLFNMKLKLFHHV